MINGIGSSYSNYLNYQQTISQVRLQQALSKNPNYQSYQKQVSSTQDAYRDRYRSSSLDFLRDYSSTMSNVMSSANSLRTSNSTSVTNQLAAVSSDTDVATVTNRYTLREQKDITLDVTQLAVAQQNRSEGVRSNVAAEGDMAFSISGANGKVDINISATREDGTTKTNIQMLREAATAINKSDAGVIASVKQENGKSVLNLQSKSTGTDSAFEVTGQLGAAEGLQNVNQEALNAEYTVTTNGETQSYTSQSNSVQLDYGRLQAELKDTGSTELSVGPDNQKIISAVSDLLKSYNNAVDFLSDNAEHGRGTATQLQRFERSLASNSVLDRLGISKDKDGQLVLDEKKLAESLKKDPGLTKDLISGSNGLAQNLYNRGVSAMNTNSASLISNDISAINENAFYDPFQYMGMYSRSGAYTTNNYAALGMMMNYLV